MSDLLTMLNSERVVREMRRAGVPRQEVDAFMAEATFGDYDHLLQTCKRWVDVT